MRVMFFAFLQVIIDSNRLKKLKTNDQQSDNKEFRHLLGIK